MAMLRATLAALLLSFLPFAVAVAIHPAGHPSSNKVDYDVIVVGGGPAGLSATSGLARVRRKTLMLDSGEYRNAATREMHDVIGNDGTVPSVFRALAREQISKYPTVTMKNATVMSITPYNNGSRFRVVDDKGHDYTARRIILGTGMKDILPSTPGVVEAWGKGIFWCPWCDGYEHRDQPFGILGPLPDVMGGVLEIKTLNSDIIAFVNGTYTPENEAALAAKYPNWKAQLAAYNVKINNLTITSIDRLQDGAEVHDPEKGLQFDKFLVNLADGSSVERNAFLANFPSDQLSTLPAKLNLTMVDKKIQVNSDMQTSLNGVYAVGDANSDGSTNVPHAMFSGKRAAVYIHVALAREESLASISKRTLSARMLEEETHRMIGNDLEELWHKVELRATEN
ncbi:uncharacterized protein VTP21DRAFT_2572 [Calcarisporiella thermophila]|uniref:uncharacterized protein n=1 Tax=Calcarisporiella thermophila TaxID=911321 RepID=UPI0037422215